MCQHTDLIPNLTPGHNGECRFCHHDNGPTAATVARRSVTLDTRHACAWGGCSSEAVVTLYAWAAREVCGYHADVAARMARMVEGRGVDVY